MKIWHHIKSIGEMSNNPVVLEIGAHTGGSTAGILKFFDKPKYYAFEPDPRNIKKFKHRHPQLTLIEKAVGNSDGVAIFHLSAGERRGQFTGGSSIHKPTGRLLKMYPQLSWSKTIATPICKLDTFFDKEKLDHIDFIWCDTQGAEIDIARGGLKTLSRTRFWYTEYAELALYENQGTLSDILKLIGQWDIVEKYKCNVLLKNRAYGDK